MIPIQNVRNLMLKSAVREAVAAGRFHIWAIGTIDEGLEILTGVSAGQRTEEGNWPEASINGRVDARLRQLAETVRSFGPAKENGS